MEITNLTTACFDRWQVNFSTIQQVGFTLYKFSIADYRSGSQYDHPGVYTTETKAYLSAYFLCLRASLDREQQPALLIDLETGYILSSNLPAFELLAINATGANVSDFVADFKDHQQIKQRVWQTEDLHQSVSVCDADGFPIKCNIQAKTATHYARWAILYFQSSLSIES